MKAPRHLAELLKRLSQEYKNSETALHFRNPYELVVATILSAQCTDERVNKVTPALFARFPNAESLAQGRIADIEKLVQSTGFYRNKAKNLQGMAQRVVETHGGRIPDSIEELVALPGIGRKTANVVLGNAFGKPAGVVVDTHVKRLSFRLGLTKQSDPVKVEKDLNALIPQEYWTEFPHWLIWHGRRVCTARKPACERCIVAKLCPKMGLRLKASSSRISPLKRGIP